MSTDSGYLLLVEDEPILQDMNKKILSRSGYNVKQAYTLNEARAIIKENPPKGIILDLQLPDGSGLDLLTELRETSNIPVLILTAYGSTEDIIRGFDLGTDEYLVKPYEDIEIFRMRVENLLRRASAVPDTLEYGAIKLFPASGIAELDGVDMLLSQKEYSILQLLVQNTDKLLSSELIYEKVWGQEMLEGDSSLKVTIAKLRKKFADSDYTITASRGEGYYLERV